MERRKNLPVLPSNAPALSQSEDQIPSPSLQSAVLRATSGNASLTPLDPSIFDNKIRNPSQYESKPPATYANPPYHTAQAAIRLTQKKERRNIWQRWELHSPRYLAYRRKARSKKAGSKEDVWPDDVEEAFQIAIRLYAKRGRTKDELNGRQAGGNEFISDWIEKQTGQRRCRKQISSHIQTLKGFLSDVPAWMDLVTAWPAGKYEKAKAVKHGGSNYQDPDFVANIDSVPRPHGRNNRPPPLPILGSNAVQEPSLRSVQFDMHLSNETSNTKTHIYTSIQSEIGSAARNLEQIPHWQQLFPKLASRYDEGRIDCPLFLFESRLRLINDIRVGLSLGIEFAIDFADGEYFDDWRSVTRIHRQESARPYFDDGEFEETLDRLESLESNGGQRDIQLTIPFKSKWWVKLFSSIISERDVARNAKDREAVKYADDCAAAHLRDLSIMQELWATRKGGPSDRPQRMATLLWTFSQSRNGEAATTTWRPLILSNPASPYQVQEPMLDCMQPSMNLDSTLQDSMVQVQPELGQQQPSALYAISRNDEVVGPSFFSENSEALLTSHPNERQTDSTTPILDYTSSFPSSTSTSFPSSISNTSAYPGHHGSSFDSQDGRSSYTHSLESSFHSQHSNHDPNDTTIYGIPPETLASFKRQPGTFSDSQELLFSSHPSSMYENMSEYPALSHRNSIDDPTIVVQPTHHADFSGGPLHIAYEDQQGQVPPDQLSPSDDGVFPAPLIAPRANLLPQQQIGECLQNFESWVPPPPPTTANTPAIMMRTHAPPRDSDDMDTDDLPPENGYQVEENSGDDGDENSEHLCRNGQFQLMDYNNTDDRQQATQYPRHQQASDQQLQQQRFATAEDLKSSQTQPIQQIHRHHHAEEADQDEPEDSETQRQHQIQYLQDAHDHWEHSFNSALWPLPELQLPDNNESDEDAMIENKNRENGAADISQSKVKDNGPGNLTEGAPGLEGLTGARVWGLEVGAAGEEM